MRTLLITTALVMPLTLGAALAQQTAPQPADPAAQAPASDAKPMEPMDANRAEAEKPTTMDKAEADKPMDADEAASRAPAAAQDDADSKPLDAASAEKVVRDQKPNELLMDWVTGATVRSPDGDTVGEVEDVIVDKDSGKVTGAILSVGGFLGIGSKDIAVAWEELQIDYDAQEISIDLTRDDAEAAPEYAYRDQEDPPAPAASPVGTTGTGMGTVGGGAGMGTAGSPPPASD